MSAQQTLTGKEAEDRKVPATMLECPECGEAVLRSRRDGHPHDLTEAHPVEKAVTKRREDKVPHMARVTTNTWRVEFTYEYREVVSVEAEDKHEAYTIAEEKRDYSGELVDTLHKRASAWGEESAATLDYLEERGLLPDDHDITQADIEAVIDS